MFDSLFRYGEKRRTVSVMVIVKEVRFQKNGYFIPRSIYCLYQEKDPSQRITSSNNLMTLSDTKVIPINDTLKFHASLFESKSDNKLVDKKRRIMLRQVSIIDEQEAYRDIAYFDLQLDSLVQGPRCVHCSFDLVDEQQLMSGQVEVTLRYRFRDSEVASPSSSSNSLLLRKQSSSMRSFRSESSYFEDWSDDEAKEEGEREGGISSSVSGQQQQQSQHHSTMSRQISGQFELPSLNRVNSVAPPRSAVVEVSTAAAPPSSSSSNPNVGRPLPTPSLQRKVTNENISSFCFTSEGVPVDSRELPPSLPNRYGPSLTQPYQSNASMLSTDSTGNNNKKNEEQRGVSSSSPQVGISHAQLAERSTLSMESLHSSNSSRGGGAAGGEAPSPPPPAAPQVYVKLLARSTSVNSIRSLGTAKSNSVKSVRFDDDVMFGGAGGGGAAGGSGGGKQRGAGGAAAVLTEEEEFGVTFDELEEFYQ